MLKGYGAPKQDLKAFYMAVIRSTLEYCAQIWHGNLTKEQSTDISSNIGADRSGFLRRSEEE